MVAERAVFVVIFAVYVGRDRAAHGRKRGAGRYGRHKPARHERVDQCAERDACLAFQDAAGRIERQQPVEPFGEDGRAAVALGGIAIGFARTARHDMGSGRRQGGIELVLALGSRGAHCGRAHAAPPCQRRVFPAKAHV